VLQNALDKNGKTALDLCENINDHDWQSAASLLRIAMSRPVNCTVPAAAVSLTVMHSRLYVNVINAV